MPYIKSSERRIILKQLSNKLHDMFLEFYETGNAKYINYVIFRAALAAVKTNPRYETWRITKSVLQDILDEFKHRMNDYETEARQKNGDVI